MRSHFPKNPFCKVCSISKTTSARVAHRKDARSDDKVDVPTAPFQQLATDSVILAMGDEHLGVGFGGIKSHHVVRDVFSGVRLAYPVSRRDTQAHVKKIRQFSGLRATDSPPACLIEMESSKERPTKSVSSRRQACQTGGPTIPSWSATSVKRRSAAAASTCNLGCPIRCIRLKPNGRLSQRKSSKGGDAVSDNWFGTEN